MKQDNLLIISLAVIGLFLIITPELILINNKIEVKSEKLCVDGYGDRNLEGIMCEDNYSLYFGLGEEWSMVIYTLSSMSIIVGFMCLWGSTYVIAIKSNEKMNGK